MQTEIPGNLLGHSSYSCLFVGDAHVTHTHVLGWTEEWFIRRWKRESGPKVGVIPSGLLPHYPSMLIPNSPPAFLPSIRLTNGQGDLRESCSPKEQTQLHLRRGDRLVVGLEEAGKGSRKGPLLVHEQCYLGSQCALLPCKRLT